MFFRSISTMLLVILTARGSATQVPFKITGVIDGVTGKSIVLRSVQFGVVDSVFCKTDTFYLGGLIPQSDIYFFEIEEKGSVPIYLDSTAIFLRGSFAIAVDEFQIDGSKDCNLFRESIVSLKKIAAQRKQLKNALERQSVAGIDEIYRRSMDSLENEVADILLQGLNNAESESLIDLFLIRAETEGNNDLVLVIGDSFFPKAGFENINRSFSALYRELNRQRDEQNVDEIN